MKYFAVLYVACFILCFGALGCNGSISANNFVSAKQRTQLTPAELQDHAMRTLAERINITYANDSSQRTILLSKVEYVSMGQPGCSYAVRVGTTLISGAAWISSNSAQDTWICNVQVGTEMLHDSSLVVTK